MKNSSASEVGAFPNIRCRVCWVFVPNPLPINVSSLAFFDVTTSSRHTLRSISLFFMAYKFRKIHFDEFCDEFSRESVSI